MPVRALFSSFLLAVILAASVSSAPAVAKTPAKHVPAKKKKAKKKVKRVKHAAVKAPAAPTGCANTELIPDAGNVELIRAALVCLHNQTRAQNGLVTLADNGALVAAATVHADDMIARGYFEHDAPDGATFVDRIMAAGYASKGEGWNVGENLIWSTGELATPAGLMRSWMGSEGHRDNILKSAYRELGLSVRVGTPTGAAGGVTISAEFGARSRYSRRRAAAAQARAPRGSR